MSGERSLLGESYWPLRPMWSLVFSREEFGEELPLLSMSAQFGVRRRVEGEGRAASADTLGYRVVRPGDLVVNRLSAREGAYGVSQLHGLVSPAYWVLRPQSGDLDSRWLGYVLRSSPYKAEIGRISKYMPPAQFDLPWDQFRLMRVPVPPIRTQRVIADYLDTETARIDALTVKKQALEKTLKAREVAHLSVLWEKAADRWGTVRLGRRVVRMEQGWSPQCEDRLAEPFEYGVVKAGCVNGGRFRATEHKALPEDTPPRLEYILRSGDLLVSRASGSLDLIGSAALLPESAPDNLILCDKMYRLATDSWTAPAFVALMLRSHRVREAIKLGVSGGEGMANNLPSGVIRGLPIPDAPLAEQRKIVHKAHEVERETEALVTSLGRSIDLLAERRQALITAAVTEEWAISGVA